MRTMFMIIGTVYVAVLASVAAIVGLYFAVGPWWTLAMSAVGAVVLGGTYGMWVHSVASPVGLNENAESSNSSRMLTV